MDDVLFVLTFAFALLVLAVPGAARGGDAVVLSLTPARSASFPHDCDWTWDVEQERCWWDRSGTLLVGGDGARTWRGGVRFDFSGLPPGLALVDGSLAVPDLGVCLGLGPCDRDIVLDVVPMIGHDWFHEREPDVGPVAARTSVVADARPDELLFDVTELVSSWLDASLPNLGLLLKLADGTETAAAAGLRFAATDIRLDLVLVPP